MHLSHGRTRMCPLAARHAVGAYQRPTPKSKHSPVAAQGCARWRRARLAHAVTQRRHRQCLAATAASPACGTAPQGSAALRGQRFRSGGQAGASGGVRG
eukprot:357868-Chlamydomonas_euryale.AAC.1